MGRHRTLHLTSRQGAYVGWLRSRGFSPDTMKLYAGVYHRCENAVGPLEAADLEHIAAWLDNWQGSTREVYMRALSSALDWLQVTEQRGDHPLKLDQRSRPLRPPAPARRPKSLSPDLVAQILATADGDMLIWLQLALRQGLRVHEIAKIRGEHITPETLTVTGKGSKTCDLPTDPTIWAIAETMPREGWWFPSEASRSGHVHRDTITRRVGDLFEQLGTDGSIHRCRHTYATMLLRGGMDLEEVRALCRHGSIRTTQLYLSSTWERLRGAAAVLDVAYGRGAHGLRAV